MVVETRGAEPQKEDKSHLEQIAPWLVAGLVGAGAIGAGVHHFNKPSLNPVNTPGFENPPDPDITPYPEGPPLTSLTSRPLTVTTPYGGRGEVSEYVPQRYTGTHYDRFMGLTSYDSGFFE